MRWALLVLVALQLEAQSGAGWKEAIAWLPPETETLIVNAKPYRVPERMDTDELGFEAALRAFAFTAYDEMPKELAAVAGQEVEFTVSGVARYLPVPQGPFLGIAPVVSVSVVRFQRPVRVVPDGMHRFVAVKKIWFVTQPEPDLLLLSTTENLLPQVLERRMKPPQVGAMPPDLEAWSDVYPSAEAFAIRRYTSGARIERDEVIDPAAQFLVVNLLYGFNQVQLVYRSRGAEIAPKLQQLWPTENGPQLLWRSDRPGVWTTGLDVAHFGVLLALLSNLGFEIAL